MQYLSIEELDAPSFAETDVTDDRWIDARLKSLLFGPFEGRNVPTYFVLDPTLRTNISGTFDLEPHGVGLPFQCLFKGAAVEELREVAPYIIDMTLPSGAYHNPDKVPPFHRDFFARHWSGGTGVFLRADHDMASVVAHFRRITRYVGENNRGYLFRFWESNALYDYLGGLMHDPFKTRNVFMSRHVLISEIICFGRLTGRLHSFRPNVDGLRRDAPELAPFTIDAADTRALMRSLLRPLAIEVTGKVSKDDHKCLRDRTPRQIEAYVLNAIERMHGFGFTSKAYLEELVVAELRSVSDVEALPGDQRLMEVLITAPTEQTKFERAMQFLENRNT